MDADGRIIPIVDDDQGEGFKDPLDVDDLVELYKEVNIQTGQKRFFDEQYKIFRKRTKKP